MKNIFKKIMNKIIPTKEEPKTHIEDTLLKEIIHRIIPLTRKDPKTLVERTLKASEELGELAQAVLSYTAISGCSYKNKTIDDVLEECIDELMIVLSIMAQVQDYDFDMEKFEKLFGTKMAKWEDKVING